MDEKPRFSPIRWNSLAASCRRIAVTPWTGCSFCTESSGILPDFPWSGWIKSQGFHPSAGTHWRRLLYEKYQHPVGTSLAILRPLVLIGDILSPDGSRVGREGGDVERSCRTVTPASWIPIRTHDQRGGVHAHERAMEASEARMAKRSGRAVNEGPDGLSERLASGRGQPRAVIASLLGPGFQRVSSFMSEGVPMPTSERRKRAKPGWRSEADVQ